MEGDDAAAESVVDEMKKASVETSRESIRPRNHPHREGTFAAVV
jgi:hypothetical protein